jgi:DNA-directed RNA polymerase subunit RPC12/RpoP
METSTLIWLLSSSSVVLLAATVWFLRRGARDQDSVRYCRCSSCGQKLRYPASRTGRKGRCPRCGHEELLVERPLAADQHALRVGTPMRRTGQTPRPRGMTAARP